jgi:dCTP deaminase
MSLIPLTEDSANPTVVDTTEAFHAAGDIEGTAVLIRGLDHAQLTPAARNSNISYDLRVGAEYRDHREIGKRDLKDGEVLRILPGMAVIIETLEEVHLPRSIFGLVVPKVALAQEGLTTTASKVDPGYHGRLLITAFNLGKSKVTLSKGDVLCSICFVDVRPGGRVYEKPAKKLSGQATRGAWPSFRYRLEANSGAWLVILTIITALSIVANVMSALLRGK